ncbi:Hypothetical protein LUCI_1935 [Lucifera butyrica]|uniref:NIF system FeS cluster assembly NifU C-terminal domain-containing protein n=1 Tax=Lucifera butyrica TaxID=1351585 RepID=A0A498R691_9FIRM|nr:NifU family protein [Lucifera butyrica]VBB06699.1 Hypothetical protein LUCI_1935 [Lucifera butyrica]
MEKLAEVIANKVRPVLAGHNGNIELLEVTPDGYVKVKLLGACSACPGAQLTLSELVARELKEVYPELKGVVPLQPVSDDLIEVALAILRQGKSRNEQ